MVDRRALIVSTGRDRGSLAAVRALDRAGWYVGVGTPDGHGMLTATRACARRHDVPRPRGDGSAFVDGVRRAVTEGSYGIVFGAGDDWMAALAAYREDIPAPVAHPPTPAVNAGLDKLALTRAAHGAGIDAPRTEPVNAETLAAWQGPVVIKSRTHWAPDQVRPHRIEARRFPDVGAARERIEHLDRAGAEPVLQQPVEGHLSALIGLFHDGRLDGRVQQVTARLWPTPNGVSTRARTVTVDHDLATRAERLLGSIGWSGLVELQFLRDDADTPHLIDLNGRFYGSMALADAARPGLAHTWALRVLGEPTDPLPDGRAGVRYSWTAGDLRRAAVERRGGLVRDMVDSLRWSKGSHHSVWDLRDLGPTRRLTTERLLSIGR